MGADREDVISDIRAVLVSTRGGMSERSLIRDYRSLIGKEIPFKELGYRSLLEFLKTVDGLRFYSSMGETFVDALPDEKTSHISSLVARTRVKKSKGSSKSRRGPVLRRAPPPRMKTFPSNVAAIPRPKYGNPSPPYGAPPKNAIRVAPKPLFDYPPIYPQRKPLTELKTAAQNRLTNLVQPPTPTAPATTKYSCTATNGSCVSPPLSDSSGRSSSLSSNASSDARPSSAGGKPTVNMTRARSAIVKVKPSGVHHADINEKWLEPGTRQKQPNNHGKMNGTPQSAANLPPQRLNLQQHHLIVPPVQAVVPPVQAIVPPVQAAYVSNKPRMRLAEQKIVFKSRVEELEHLSMRLGLGLPEIRAMERRPSNKKPLYTGVVKIGAESFSSYPDELPDREQALELVASIACGVLQEKLTPINSPSLDEAELIERVKNIVGDKSNGMYNKAVEDSYKNKYNEYLPSNWLESVSNCRLLSVERFNSEKVIIYPANEMVDVFRPITPKPVKQVAPTVESMSVKSSTTITQQLAPCTTDEVTSLPKIQYPSENRWEVFVSSASSDDIWLRLIGEEYDVIYNDAVTNLEIKLLGSNGVPVQTPIVNNFYLVKFDQSWSRVQLLEICPSSDDSAEPMADVFLVDNGETDTIKLSDLRHLDCEVCSVPAQAIQCRLACVKMDNKEVQDYLLQHVIGSSYVADVLQRPSEEGVAIVVLYDTEAQETIKVNEVLSNLVIDKITPAKLPKSGLVDLRLSHAEPGSVFVQLGESGDLTLLNLILSDLNLRDVLSEMGMQAYPTIKQMESSSDALFLVRSRKAPSEWRRGLIVGIKNHNRPIVHFLDYGYNEVVMISDMFDLEKVFPPLCKFPKQAIPVKLSQISQENLAGGVISKLKELAPPDCPILAKVIDYLDLPVVELFKRIPPDNLIVSINVNLVFSLHELLQSPEILEMEPETQPRVDPLDILKCSNGESEVSPHSPQQTNAIHSPHPLETFKGSKDETMQHDSNGLVPFSIMEDSSEYFDVVVTLSSNPSYFVVQPLQMVKSTFAKMMTSMQGFYEEHESTMPVPSCSDLIEGAAFAGKHPEDLQWYRVTIIARIHSTLVTVRFADYGDITLLPVDRLRFLDHSFKSLPSLAIRAKLHGVLPKSGDWSVEDSLSFNDLVNNMAFVSIVMETNSESGDAEWQVSLQLYDTSTEQDVNIADKLVEMDIALRA